MGEKIIFFCSDFLIVIFVLFGNMYRERVLIIAKNICLFTCKHKEKICQSCRKGRAFESNRPWKHNFRQLIVYGAPWVKIFKEFNHNSFMTHGIVEKSMQVSRWWQFNVCIGKRLCRHFIITWKEFFGDHFNPNIRYYS